VKNDASGIIYKAYENDGVVFPATSGRRSRAAAVSSQSGRRVFGAADRFSPYCQYSAPRPVPTSAWPRSIRGPIASRHALGVPFGALVPWPGGDHARRFGLPDGECRYPGRWPNGGKGAPPSPGRTRTSCRVVRQLPGVDDADIYEFLDQHARD
jgi:hypothetical protein